MRIDFHEVAKNLIVEVEDEYVISVIFLLQVLDTVV